MKSSFALLAALGLAGLATAGEPNWKKHDINAKSPFEAAGAFDVDNDGDLDVVCGDTLYLGPDFQTRHKVRDVTSQGTYYNCFATLPVDVNGDGFLDYYTCSYFGKNVGWVENPGKVGAPWTYHEIDLPGTSEAAWLEDLTGDGKPELLPNPTNAVAFYQLRNPGKDATFKKFDFGTAAAGHGVGTGDINGDGRPDLLTPKGWFEAPKDPENETWPWHPEWELGATGIQILGRDFDGDGLTDIVWGMGHAYGLYWSKQSKEASGDRVWSSKKPIDEKVASVHTLLWADLNGDGKNDEMITGKRVYAHEVEPGDTDASEIAYYRFNRASGEWDKHLIYKGEPAKNAPPVEKRELRDAQKDFAPGTAGTGLQMMAVDMDKDGDLDLLCPGKSGLYWFENLGN
jgi:hypothetical protein